jgi:hypothetical protein
VAKFGEQQMPLTASEYNVLETVKVVGMRYYSGAHQFLWNINNTSVPEDRCLFLVADVANTHDKNAVMLHNGKQKLGNVRREDAPRIKNLLDKWKQESGYEMVIAVNYLHHRGNTFAEFTAKLDMAFRGLFKINERTARKFSKLKVI